MKLNKVLTGKFKRAFTESEPTDFSKRSICLFLGGLYSVSQIKTINSAYNHINKSSNFDYYYNLDDEDKKNYLSLLSLKELKEFPRRDSHITKLIESFEL